MHPNFLSPILSGKPQRRRLVIFALITCALAAAFAIQVGVVRQTANTSDNRQQNQSSRQELPSPSPSGQSTSTANSSPTTTHRSPTPTASIINGNTSPSITTIPPTAIPVAPEIAWGNRNRNQVILTFDAGAGKQSLDSILETLREYNIKASFFVTGQWVEKFPDGLRSIANAGHAIYNHTYSHPHFATLSDDDIKNELEKTDTLIKSIVGFDSKPYFRAPYGERNQRVLAVAASLGYRHAYWTIDAWDWKEGITAGEVKSRILQNVKPGTIYLMHVGDDISGAILPEIIQSIKKQGYEIVPLNQGATDH